MSFALRVWILTMAMATVGAVVVPGAVHARGLYGGVTLWLSCENGSRYAIRPIAVSDEGDLVTGRLVVGQRQGVHVRLIPSGEGYRYAGRGVWFDGWRESVYLYRSKYRPIACTVVGEAERVGG